MKCKTIELNNKTKIGGLKNISKINKLLTRLMRKTRGKKYKFLISRKRECYYKYCRHKKHTILC